MLLGQFQVVVANKAKDRGEDCQSALVELRGNLVNKNGSSQFGKGQCVISIVHQLGIAGRVVG